MTQENMTVPARFPPSAPQVSIWWWLAALVLLGAWLRYPALSGDLWMDEIWSFRIAHSEPSMVGLVANQAWANNHLLNTLWLRGLNESTPEIFFRLPSFLCGLACIPLAAWVLLRWGAKPPTAIFGAALVTLGFFQIQFSTEARGYSGAFACALVALGLRFSDRGSPHRWVRVLAFGGFQVLGMLWHPGYVLFVVGLALAQAAFTFAPGASFRQGFVLLVRWQALPGLAVIAYQVGFLSRLRYGAAGYQEPVRPILEAAGWTLNLAWLPLGPLLATILLLFGLALGVIRIAGRHRELAVALVLVCLVLPAGLVLVHPPHVTGNPSLLVLFPRYFHLPFAVALLAVAWGVGELPHGRKTARAGLILTLALGLWFLLPPFHRFGRGGYRKVLEHLAAGNEGLIRIGTNELTRGMMQFGFYADRMGIADRLVWVEPAQWLLAPPDYMLSLAPGALPATLDPPRIVGGNREIRYELDRAFPYAGASGFNCVLFRRSGEGTARRP